tara:strand:- start:41 stop:547 length:507 start_codon:yes stop_codon:yes gene_type:complete
MDVKKQEYMLKHDKNIGKLWTERYESQQAQQPKNFAVKKPAQFRLRQRFWQPNKPSYYVVTADNHYNLNYTVSIHSKFARLIDKIKTDRALSDDWKGWQYKTYSSEGLRFQLLTIYKYGKFVEAILVYNKNQISIRTPSPQSRDGQVGSWIWDREYREIPFSIWEEFE